MIQNLLTDRVPLKRRCSVSSFEVLDKTGKVLWTGNHQQTEWQSISNANDKIKTISVKRVCENGVNQEYDVLVESE